MGGCRHHDFQEIFNPDYAIGSEFLNWHLVRYFQERPKAVGFTRSRPYHKDDNGHVEQKNWTHVRQLLGYERFEDPGLLDAINSLYRDVWGPLHNFFMPSMKLLSKDRHGAKVKRLHDLPQTPCQRLLNSQDISPERKRMLVLERDCLNPFTLHEKLEEGLRRVLHRALHSSRPSDVLRYASDEATIPLTTVS